MRLLKGIIFFSTSPRFLYAALLARAVFADVEQQKYRSACVFVENTPWLYTLQGVISGA